MKFKTSKEHETATKTSDLLTSFSFRFSNMFCRWAVLTCTGWFYRNVTAVGWQRIIQKPARVIICMLFIYNILYMEIYIGFGLENCSRMRTLTHTTQSPLAWLYTAHISVYRIRYNLVVGKIEGYVICWSNVKSPYVWSIFFCKRSVSSRCATLFF